MNARPALRRVENEAGLRAGVVGDLGALVPGQECGVGLARGDHRDSARSQQGPQPDAQGKSRAFFQLAVCQPASQVVTPMGRVEDHHKSSRRGLLRSSR